MNHHPTPPAAEVLKVTSDLVIVRCPYCYGEHTHHRGPAHERQHRAPGCGLTRSTTDRITGYVFINP
jgi:hypothetical protein